MQLSICVPTRNRAAYLGRCLEHLLTFSKIEFELIVGDNASTDGTPETAKAYGQRFPRFTFHRHASNVGFARNMDAILRMARGKYVYILSDDDMVFESALVTMCNILDETPAAASVTGRYESLEMPQIGKDIAVPNIKGFGIPQADFSGWFTALARNPALCDGHPVMRREAFQRHCWYHDRGFALGPLHTQLLATGDLLFIEQPVFQHCRNADSLSTQMTEPWFHDYCHADIELMCSIAAKPAPPAIVEAVRLTFLRIIYLQSARMARIKGELPLMWHFLRRAKAVGGVDEACLVQCEREFLTTVGLLRLATVIGDLAPTHLAVEKSPMFDAVWERLRTMLSECPSVTRFAEGAPPDDALCLRKAFDADAARSGCTILTYFDTIETCRLTTYPIKMTVEGGEPAMCFTSSEAVALLGKSSPGYKILMTDYAASR